MPELAEVEYYRKQWNPGLGRPVCAVLVHEHAKIFRGTNARSLQAALTGATFRSSQAAAKQMLFRFDAPMTAVLGKAPTVPSIARRAKEVAWLGVHLGM